MPVAKAPGLSAARMPVPETHISRTFPPTALRACPWAWLLTGLAAVAAIATLGGCSAGVMGPEARQAFKEMEASAALEPPTPFNADLGRPAAEDEAGPRFPPPRPAVVAPKHAPDGSAVRPPMGPRPPLDADFADGGSGPVIARRVPVLYATDRDGPDGGGAYAYDRAAALSFGRVVVSIPVRHVRTKVEKKRWGRAEIGRNFVAFPPERLDADEFLDAAHAWCATEVKSGDAVIFIHGFNASFEKAVFRTAQVWYDMDIDALPVMFSWPSRGRLGGYLGDRNDAEWAVADLIRLIEMLHDERSGVNRLHIVAHSTGTWIAARALHDLGLRRDSAGTAAGNEPAPIDQLVLAAPDIDAQVLTRMLPTIGRAARQTTCYINHKDKALAFSAALTGHERAGRRMPDGPLPPRTQVVDASRETSFWGLSHAYYGKTNPLLDDLAGVLRTGASAADRAGMQGADGRYVLKR